MLNKLERFLRRYEMVQPGDRVVCAVSGGADSIALLFAMYLLREKLGITLSAAHYNHQLRGAESDRDEAFVREFCHQYDIPLQVGTGKVMPGKKGLEASARDARYAFLKRLPGKIATAHTADDNAETVLMHLVRGTGLKGLGGIAPINDRLIRPMLTITREEVCTFLVAYHLTHIDDSSNDTDLFLRNRIRHSVMPLLNRENPKLAENLSAMALRLRQDEQTISGLAQAGEMTVPALKQQEPAVRSRAIAAFLEKNGVPEPEAHHIGLVERLIFSDKPSARANLPGGVVIARNYDTLCVCRCGRPLETVGLTGTGVTELPEIGLRVVCEPARSIVNTDVCFTVISDGELTVRCRRAGDAMRLPGGRKELKKLFIDRKIPAQQRLQIPIVADSTGILGVFGIGANLDRVAKELPAIQIRFETYNSAETGK